MPLLPSISLPGPATSSNGAVPSVILVIVTVGIVVAALANEGMLASDWVSTVKSVKMQN